MCSFLFLLSRRFANLANDALAQALRDANKYMKRRGPDATKVIKVGNNAIFMHNLLYISGANPVTQPLTSDDGCVFAVFNGEIYNFRDVAPQAHSDSESIIPFYTKYGHDMAKHMDGEYATVVYDTTKDRVIISSDVFMTKPLYIAFSEGGEEIGVASYASALYALGFTNVEMFKPNKTHVIDTSNIASLRTSQIIEPHHPFDLTQHKTDTNDWEKAFLEAVKKRALHGNTDNSLFVTLSSGYDSGAITAALNHMGLKYATYSSFKGENASVLSNRIVKNRLASCEIAYQINEISDVERMAEDSMIRDIAEPFTYVHDDGMGLRLSMNQDGGARALNFIARDMHEKGYRILLSGSGADEIMTDYGFQGNKIYYHSQFGGKFPDDLSQNGFFPWAKFYGDTQRSYLFKDEFIAGSHMIEGRYPYLDYKVVQEFLWLHPTLKNNVYKRPLHDFLKKHDYPFEEGAKKGFNI